MPFKIIQPGQAPLASDVNQFTQALNGTADVGTIKILPQINAPSSPTLTAVSGGVLTGTYNYMLVFASGWIDSYYNLYIEGFAPGLEGTIAITNQNVNVTIPSFPTGVVAVLIYRTIAGGTSGTEKYVGMSMIPNSVFTDGVVDNILGNTPTQGVFGSAIPVIVPSTNSTGSDLVPPTLEGVPSVIGPTGAIITVNGKLYVSNGSSWLNHYYTPTAPQVLPTAWI